MGASAQLWRRAAQATGDPCFGLRASAFLSPAAFPPLGAAILASYTLREALHRMARYGRLVADALTIEVEEDDARLRLVLAIEGEVSPPPEAVDASLALTVRVARLLSEDRQINPLSVQMRRDEPTPSGAFEGFFRAPIVFRAPRNVVEFARDDIDAALPNGDRVLTRSLEPLLAAAVVRQHGDTFVSRVREALTERLGDGVPTQGAIAQALGISQRTLQRRLADFGLSYQTLLGDTRTRLAQSYLAAGWSVTETAFRLGFASSSSLARAFRRWTGRAPSDPS